MAAAEHVGAGPGEDPDEVADIVWQLVDASLVRPEETAGATRYRLLATVRAHAAGHADPPDLAVATQRLAALLLERVGPARATRHAWATEMAVELDNVRTVIAGIDDPPVAQALAWSLASYHEDVDLFADAAAEVTRILDASPHEGPERVALLTMLADVHLRLGEMGAAEAVLSDAAELEARVGGPDWDEAAVARTRGELALRRADPQGAITEALHGLESAQSPRARARLLSLLLCARRDAGDLDGAVEAAQAGLRAEMAAGAHTFLVASHGNLAELHLQRGDAAAAAYHQAISLGLARELRKPVQVAFSLMIAARLVAARGRPQDAIALQTKADEMLAAADYVLYEDDERVRAELLDDAAARLTPAQRAAAVASGHDLGVDAAADLADAIFTEVGSSSDSSIERPVA